MSQGFDWQYSSRLPSEYPYSFIGLHTDLNFINNLGKLNFAEREIPCCKFSDGNGIKFSIGAAGEYWLSSKTSLVGTLSYTNISNHFIKKTDPIPRPYDVFQSEYIFDSKISYLDVDLRYKFRLYDTHFSYFGGICPSILLGSSSKYKEKVISQNNSFNDGSTERMIKAGKISELSSFVLPLKAGLSYDFELGRGKYFTPSVFVMYSLNNLAENTHWKYYSFGIEITIFHSFLFR